MLLEIAKLVYFLINANNNMINKNELLKNSIDGIRLRCYSNYNVICENNLSMNGVNILIVFSNGNLISKNRINSSESGFGILIGYSSRNIILFNSLSNHDVGILLDGVFNTIISKNNFIRNNVHAIFGEFYLLNCWDSNYWDNWHLKIPKPIFGFYNTTYSLG